VGLEGVAIDDKIAGKIKSAQGYRHAATRPGAWDPRRGLREDRNKIAIPKTHQHRGCG
jgi:hypothetical protein